MNYKKLVLLVIPFLLVSIVSALDLSDYPDMFIENDKFNGVLVVADNAPAEDIISVSNIAMSIQYEGDPTGTAIRKIDVGTTKLASQISDPNAQNLILVGRPKRDFSGGNPLIDEFYSGTPDGYYLKLVKNGDYYVLIVTGDTTQNVREAADILANYKDYDLKGMGSIKGPEDIPEEPKKEDKPKEMRGHYLVVDNKAPSSDVIILTDVGIHLKQKGYTYLAPSRLNSEVTKNMLHSRVTTFIYLGEAIIIVGKDTSNAYRGFVKVIEEFLEDEKDIKVKTKSSSEVKSDDLTELFPKAIKEEEEEEPEKLDEIALPSKDECSLDSDCNDDNACTSDSCSGTPKKCSNKETSVGCDYNKKCIPIGVRVFNEYCDIDKEVYVQKNKEEPCKNNYECASNICVNDKCVSPSLIQRIMNFFKGVVGKAVKIVY
jgi:hypothetical protein